IHLDLFFAILFPHDKSYHTVGLDDIRPYFFKQGDIPVYAHQRVMASLQKRFDYIFDSENKYPGAPSVQEHVITNTAFTVKGVNILPVEVMHNRVQVFGFRIRDFAYITDAKIVEEEEAEKL
ncbi:MBL fold metallo-hydrolase, partial [Salinimicrobium oceani]